MSSVRQTALVAVTIGAASVLAMSLLVLAIGHGATDAPLSGMSSVVSTALAAVAVIAALGSSTPPGA